MNHSVPNVLSGIRNGSQLSPAALDMVKLLALLVMVIDHANTVFMTPAQPWMYALGRMAFPLFTLIWATNVQRNPERLQKRANRLWIWAVITQPVFSLTFLHHQPWWALNILFVFAGVTQLLALRHRHGLKGMLAGYLLLALMIWPLQPASYGLAGITLAVSMATVSGSGTPEVKRMAVAGAVLSLICLNGLSHILNLPAETLLLATLPTLVFPLMVVSFSSQFCPEGRQRFMPRNFFYIAYAGHLGIIALIHYAVS
ncbi:TPA: conjugal transfer protein TraX [Salmonella enterica]|uniref:Conjugal transfer protein TraX n=1 Tax=Salmonella enterica TaxID=28901 RepID=A0A750MDN2_SALER|nr:conjugal transfer protein TraX [Salmonella enterica subsp. enterica serovar Derby]EJC1546085.1 conjugal transfer protein TraX [Salmonella enterica subsp. enterica serovar Montevideo]HAF6252682.1 conjugal transfer protein TraX [Salmonella enterica]HAK3958925.1 conjugal transfer protein TraX [Salmonella enterica]HAK8959661.1 conjugal transfer protein TraX [Salmonella enterica]